MKAIYKGKLYTISGDCANMVDLIDDVEAEGTSKTLSVLWSDPSLIIDPTDDQINNILPDAEAEPATMSALEYEWMRRGSPVRAQSVDQIVGCNVHGRLTHIRHLLKSNMSADAIDEINKLLQFFPKP